MSSDFPASLDSFTTKVDGVDRIMASHVNGLQDAIVAIETELGTDPAGTKTDVKTRLNDTDSALNDIDVVLNTGWMMDGDTWIYVNATQFKITGKDVTSRFPKGTKIRLVQTTTKYFYAIAAAMSGSDTLITITGGSDYSLANAAISSPAYSYADTPQGFPPYFNYTPAWITDGDPQPSLGDGVLTGKFVLHGANCLVNVKFVAGSTTTFGTGAWRFGVPIDAVLSQTGTVVAFDAGVTSYVGAATFYYFSNAFQVSTNGTGNPYSPSYPFAWAVNDSLWANISYIIQ